MQSSLHVHNQVIIMINIGTVMRAQVFTVFYSSKQQLQVAPQAVTPVAQVVVQVVVQEILIYHHMQLKMECMTSKQY